MKLINKDGKKFLLDSTGMSRTDHNKIRGKSLEDARKIFPNLKTKEVK